MTTTTAWDRFRDDVRTATVASAAEQFERLTWNSERIHHAQRDGRLVRPPLEETHQGYADS